MNKDERFRAALAACARQILISHNALEDAAAFIRGDVQGRLQRDGILREIDFILNAPVASAIEAATAGETTEIGSTEGESAAPEGGDAR